MKKKTTRSITSKKSKTFFSRFSLTKIILVLTVVLFAGAYLIKQSSVQPAVYQVKIGTPATKTLNEIARPKVTNNNTNTGEPVTKLKETFGKGNEPEEGDDNPFAGSGVSGGTGTLTVVEKAVKIVEDKISEYIPANKSTGTSLTNNSNKQLSETELALRNVNGGNGTLNKKDIKDQVKKEDENDSETSTGGELSPDKNPTSTITGGQLSPDKNPVIKDINTSGSPDDRQDKRDEQRALFGNIGSGYSGTDSNGDKIAVKTETQRLDGGASVVVSTRTVTKPNGNEIMITKTQKLNAAGGVTDENTATITKTRNENGTYFTSYSSTSGVQTTLASPDKQSDSYFALPANYQVPVAIKTGADTAGSLSPDKQSPIVCPTNTNAVKTAGKGWVCAPTSGTSCGVYSFALNGKCYPIGSEVTPGNYVCDWTIGGRPNVNYAFLSTNCPTKSASANAEPKNATACSDGDNAGWWDNNAKKCYRPGEHVALDSTRTVQVCKGGLLSKGPSCPEDAAAGNLSADKNSGVYTAPVPSPVTTNGALSADKQSNQFNPPESCRFNGQCSANGSETCSNGNKFWTIGICVPTNPTYSPDKQSDQFNAPNVKTGSETLSPDANGGMIRTVTNQNGLTDEVVSDPDDCMISGAKKNKVGAYVCPGLDGSADPSLENTLCSWSPTDFSTYKCLVQGLIYQNQNGNDKDNKDNLNENREVGSGLGSSNDDIELGLQMDSSNFLEGDSCTNTKTGVPGVWQNGLCMSPKK